MTHLVKFYESERGWGGEIWYRRFTTKEEAEKAIEDCNKHLPEGNIAPDYYIKASYEGVDESNNPKYDQTYKH